MTKDIFLITVYRNNSGYLEECIITNTDLWTKTKYMEKEYWYNPLSGFWSIDKNFVIRATFAENVQIAQDAIKARFAAMKRNLYLSNNYPDVLPVTTEDLYN